VIRLRNSQLETLTRRPSSSFSNIDGECSSADSVCCVALSTLHTPGVQRAAALPAKEIKELPTSSRRQVIEAGGLFHDSLIESGRRSKRNPWVAVGSLALPLFFDNHDRWAIRPSPLHWDRRYFYQGTGLPSTTSTPS
jgi:hypothetical protein